MPISAYYGGKGSKVMQDMKARYGGKKGENVFYATANTKDQKPKDKKPKAAYKFGRKK